MTTGKRPSRHCLQRLRQFYPRLSATQQVVAGYILQNPADALSSSVHELADRCNTSPSTIVRLAKDIGFEGIKELKLALAQEIGTLLPRISAQERDGDDDAGHARELLENTVYGLEETANGIDLEAIERAVELMKDARHVDVYGAASSYLVGLDLVEKLKRLGIYAATYENNYVQAISSAGLGPEDLAVAFSYSGETRSVVENLAMAREQGARTVAITNFRDSTIVQVADIVIPTSVSRHLVPDGSLGGRMAQLFVVDLIFINLFASDPPRFRAAYRKYNEILLKKVSKNRDPLGDRDSATDDERSDGARRELAGLMKLVGGPE